MTPRLSIEEIREKERADLIRRGFEPMPDGTFQGKDYTATITDEKVHPLAESLIVNFRGNWLDA